MSWLSGLFGGNKDERALADLLRKVRQIIEDESLQNSMQHPAFRELTLKGAAVDSLPGATGEFGYCLSNPIPVNGSIGELAYLSKLETDSGQRILFHRVGSIDTKDVFEAVAFDGSEWFILFIDLYHPRRSTLTPKGFRFFSNLGLFSGFHNFCSNFPYDFLERRRSDDNDLSIAYISSEKVAEFMARKVYQRPLAHKLKLELIRNRLQGIHLEGSAVHDVEENPSRRGNPPLPENMADVKHLMIDIIKDKFAMFPILAVDLTLVPAVDIHYLRIYPQMRATHCLTDIVDESFRLAFPPNGIPLPRQ